MKRLPVTDFRAVRGQLEPHEFAIGEGQDVPPSDPIEQEIWDGIVRLPEDVSIRISDHNGIRLRLLYTLWGDWITSVGNPDAPVELSSCMLDATDCFQCANFNFLHGFYRAALAELRTALELLMIGVYGNLNPTDEDYLEWKQDTGDLSFVRCRRRLAANLRKEQARWMFEEGAILAVTYQALCNYSHSRPDASDSALWRSNGPVYNAEAIKAHLWHGALGICPVLSAGPIGTTRFHHAGGQRHSLRARLDGRPHGPRASLHRTLRGATQSAPKGVRRASWGGETRSLLTADRRGHPTRHASRWHRSPR